LATRKPVVEGLPTGLYLREGLLDFIAQAGIEAKVLSWRDGPERSLANLATAA
jgi:hypothetical protein